MLVRSDERFSLSFCNVLISGKQVPSFSPFSNLFFLSLLGKPHLIEDMVFRSSDIFKINFFSVFFYFLQRILKSFTSRYEWLISEIIIATGAGKRKTYLIMEVFEIFSRPFLKVLCYYLSSIDQAQTCLKKDD